MLEIRRQKLHETPSLTGKVVPEQGDTTKFNLDTKFDLLIALYRVLQNLEEDEKVCAVPQRVG